MAATQVYIEQLYKQGHGWPLWYPDSCEVYVGDVGFFERDSGSFCRLFNVLVGEEDPLNNRGVPDDFTPLQLKPEDVRHTMQPWTAGQCLKTQTVTASEAEFQPFTSDILPVNAGINFDCSKNLGALLLLRNHSARVDLRNTSIVRDYIRNYLNSWYIFARLQGFDDEAAPENSIVLVRGCDKSDSWALAAFAERAQNASVFFNGAIYAGSGGMELRGTWRRHTISSAEHRDGSVTEVNAGRRRVDLATSGIWNALGIEPLSACVDCLFVRIFRCRRRWGPFGIPLRIKAQAGPHELSPKSLDSMTGTQPIVSSGPRQDDDDEGVEIHLDSNLDLSKHPLDALLSCMLNSKKDALLAIATDEDLYQIVTDYGDQILEGIYKETVNEAIDVTSRVDSDWTVTLDRKNKHTPLAREDYRDQPDFGPSHSPRTRQEEHFRSPSSGVGSGIFGSHNRMMLNNYLQFQKHYKLEWVKHSEGPQKNLVWHAYAMINGAQYGHGTARDVGEAAEIAAGAALAALHTQDSRQY